MDITELEQLPLDRFEFQLKKYYTMRKDIHGKILTPEELAQYIRWMAKTYFTQTKNLNSNTGLPHPDIKLTEIGIRALADPGDEKAINSIFSNFQQQNEEINIIANQDISIERMFRYMPSHWHSNSYFEIYYALSPNCTVHFTDEIVHMNSGTVLIVAPGVIHASPCYRDDCILMFFLIRSSTFDHVFWNQLNTESLMSNFFQKALLDGQRTAYLQFETYSDTVIKILLSRIYNEYLEETAYRSQMMNALMSEFFVLLLRGYENTAKLPKSGQFHWKQEFSAIFAFIQTNYANTTLADVAAHFHYSERQISRIVLQYTGQNFAQLILRLRMEKAATMLKQRHSSIELIAASVGYSTLSSFYRAFTKYYHCTPGDFLSQNTEIAPF